MGKAMREATVNLAEVVLAQAYELDALLNVLGRKGLATKAEVREEIERLKGQAAKVR